MSVEEAISGTGTHWDDLSGGYDAVIDSDPSNRALLEAAVTLIPRDTGRLLDLGSGTGRLTSLCRAAAPRAHIVGADPAPSMVEQSREKFATDGDMSFAVAAAEDLTRWETGSFDVVITSFALHHIEVDRLPLAAAEIFRVLRPGGRFINADQFCRVMGQPGSRERVLDLFELLTAKARYYLMHAGLDRMLLQLDLLPRFIREDGEILTTTQVWQDVLTGAGFSSISVIPTFPEELYNRVVWAAKP